MGDKLSLRPKKGISNLACDSELMLVLVKTLATTIILLISGRDSCSDEGSNGLWSAQLHIYLFVFRRAYEMDSFIYLNSATYFTSVSSTSCHDFAVLLNRLV
jgi:hypothetical protein